MKRSVSFFKQGDVFYTHKREYYVFYKDVEITLDDDSDVFHVLYELIGDRERWSHFSGMIPGDMIYHKIAKPSFVFKNEYGWSLGNLARLTQAKKTGDQRGKMRYMGRIRGLNLLTLRAMVEGHERLTPLGNEILWQAILDLTNTENFETV